MLQPPTSASGGAKHTSKEYGYSVNHATSAQHKLNGLSTVGGIKLMVVNMHTCRGGESPT